MTDDIREGAAEDLGHMADDDKRQFVASLDAASLNALADAALELPTIVLNKGVKVRQDGDLEAMTVLRTLANARKQKANIGDRVLAVLVELQEEVRAAGRAGETQPRAKG